MKAYDDMTDEEYAAWERREREVKFLDFVALLQVGAEAIRERRRLEERLAEAEKNAAEWQKIALDGSSAMMGMNLDLVTALCSGALVKGPAEACEAAAAMMDKRARST